MTQTAPLYNRSAHLLYIVDGDEKHAAILVPEQHCARYLGIQAQLRTANKVKKKNKVQHSTMITATDGALPPHSSVGHTIHQTPELPATCVYC